MNNDPVAKSIALHQRAIAKNANKPAYLPTWPDNKRATPNTFLRSALFSGIQGRDRVFHRAALLASQSNISITYTGYQLNQEDLTLWETLVNLTKTDFLENICEFSCYEILKAMGSATGALDYKRLDDGIDRLAQGHIDINNRQYFGSLILQGSKDSKNNKYRLQLNKLLINLYQQNTWIDWDQRMLLRRKPLAQFLHGYFSSHKEPYPIKVITLLTLSGSRTKKVSKFKQNLINALQELVEVDFLESFTIEDDLVKVKKNNHIPSA